MPQSKSAQTLQRRGNMQQILDYMWVLPPCTASELMETADLTRATVLSLCKDLIELGWVNAADDTRKVGEYSAGRPAKRYRFNYRKTLVVGVDAGEHHISATVADLLGHELGGVYRSFPSSWKNGEARRQSIIDTVHQALSAAEVETHEVSVAVIGIPAPVAIDGTSPSGHNDYWGLMNPDLNALWADEGWEVAVENDANLAAIADLQADPQLKERSFATLLAGARFGSGIILNGELLRQRHGGAGELRVLEIVDGVESTVGLLARARHLAKDAIEHHAEKPTSLAKWKSQQVTALDFFAEVERHDAVALEKFDQLVDIVARVCAVLVGPLDLDNVLLSGVAGSLFKGRTEAIQERIQEYLYAPWVQVTVSPVGQDAVRLGAVQAAIKRVRETALES
ncbi:ROK family protein [Rothia nasimurium]|uniref:ROK family transcriptional regulator n=1 Tax=Rothia nasimurium TaxID=85336 RepID=UPI00361FFFDE